MDSFHNIIFSFSIPLLLRSKIRYYTAAIASLKLLPINNIEPLVSHVVSSISSSLLPSAVFVVGCSCEVEKKASGVMRERGTPRGGLPP